MASDLPPVVNPFLSPACESAPPNSNGSNSGLRISIADILFCTFAVALSLMDLFQPWGGFEESQPVYLVSGIIVAFSASIFFTANRRRRELKLPFSSFEPGHCLALISAGYLATHVLQFLVSYLDERHVGAPIHILAKLSPTLWCATACIAILFKTRFTPRWQAVFVVTAIYGAAFTAGTAFSLAATPTDFEHPFHLAASWLFRISAGTWYLAYIFVLLAYLVDFFTPQRRDWLHHAGVVLELIGCIALVFEDQMLSRFLWYFYYVHIAI
jgi:hypothetical protein